MLMDYVFMFKFHFHRPQERRNDMDSILTVIEPYPCQNHGESHGHTVSAPRWLLKTA